MPTVLVRVMRAVSLVLVVMSFAAFAVILGELTVEALVRFQMAGGVQERKAVFLLAHGFVEASIPLLLSALLLVACELVLRLPRHPSNEA